MKKTKINLPRGVIRDIGPDKKERFYFRRAGQKKIRITGVPWTPSFMAQYQSATGGVEYKQPIPPKRRGTFTWLCDQYFSSAEFKKLDVDKTQKTRRSTLLNICSEPTVPGGKLLMGDVNLSAWNKNAVRAMRDRVAQQPERATARVKAMRQVFGYGIEADLCESNPARDVKYLSTGTEGFHAWTVEEIEKFEKRWTIGTRERLAFALLLYTGQRLSDIIALGPHNVKDGWLHLTQHKNRNKKPVHVQIPIRPELQHILDKTKTGTDTFLHNTFGKPYLANTFNWFFAEACKAAGVPGRAHGLRKAFASQLAELGSSENEIMSLTGHQTSKEVTRYTKAARQRVMAEKAMARHTK